MLAERARDAGALLRALDQGGVGAHWDRLAKRSAHDIDRAYRLADHTKERCGRKMEMKDRHDIGTGTKHAGKNRRFARRIVFSLDFVSIWIHYHQIIGGHNPGMTP